MVNIHKHTEYDEYGAPIFKIQDLAELSARFVINKRTGKSPDAYSYQETMRKRIFCEGSNLIPSTINRRANNDRIVKGEALVTIPNWIEAHRTANRWYLPNLAGMEDHLNEVLVNPNSSTYQSKYSDISVKTSKKGQTYGPNENKSPESWTTVELPIVDYVKTEKLEAILEDVQEKIALGKNNFQDDDWVARDAFEELMLGIAMIGGIH